MEYRLRANRYTLQTSSNRLSAALYINWFLDDDPREPQALDVMSPRRSVYDPLQISAHPPWLVVRTMCRDLLEQRLLPPGSDLCGVFVTALAAHVAAGWTLETFSSNTAGAFCHLGSERRAISIEAEDPSCPTSNRSLNYREVL
jgi:hypothetical protein